jgi:uncharacterized LabA/DUF88 family protein
MTAKGNGPQEGAVGPTDKPSAGYGDEDSSSSATHQVPSAPLRVSMYVDGFNLYHGMHSRFQRRYLWLDLQALATKLLKAGQKLEEVHYFTARMRGGGDSAARQTEYLGALRATGVNVVEGRFQEKHLQCRACRTPWLSYEEKESDVSLSVSLVEHAAMDKFDVVLLLTGDSDMCPAVRAVRRLNPQARVIAVFPPARTSGDLRRTAHGSMQLGQAPLRQSQLPESIATPKRTYQRPAHWK